MIRGRTFVSSGWLLLAFAAAGCASTGVGNPGIASLQLSIVDDDADGGASASDGGVDAAADADAGTDADTDASDAGYSGDAGSAGASSNSDDELPEAAIQDAVVVLGELRFLPCDASAETVTAPGPFVVNLLAKTTVPAIPMIAGTPGGYCGIDAPLAPATSPATLAGRSLFFDGYRADGAFFLVYANMTGTLRLRATPGASWQAMTPPPLFFWAMRPRSWLMQSELDSADVVPYDTHQRAVVIDADRHAALYLAIRMRLAGVSTLYEDANGDGVFDDGDRGAIVGQGSDDAD